MTNEETTPETRPPSGWWSRTPLYLRILGALILGLIVGTLLGPSAAVLEIPANLILRMLGALAPPLILIAVVQAIMHADIQKGTAGRLAFLLGLNTLVAIIIGLVVANVIRPGKLANLTPTPKPSNWQVLYNKESDPFRQDVGRALEAYGVPAPVPKKDVFLTFLDNVPKSLAGPLVENNVIGIILIALAFGIALRRNRDRPLRTVSDVVAIAMDTVLTILHWIIAIVPIGVFGIVASTVGQKGFQPFLSLGYFIVTVLVGLALQATYYLTRVRFGSWVSPMRLLQGGRDALLLAFSTASSTATMPVNYEGLKNKVGLRARSAGLGALVGTNFNNDGTALYEAASALFISQMVGQELNLFQQVLVVLTSVMASVGAAGIPEAGLVTMTLVFTAVGLDTRYIALLLTVDWFLDRCRTAINIMGDMNIACLLDGKTQKADGEE
ncbi:MAG: dicarboxylate/amino acid:cation symporter [Capsulimonadales bacterium]|nr:dicarboxylate/amino acid:cation symporter [Capsulimonadales bacterium]